MTAPSSHLDIVPPAAKLIGRRLLAFDAETGTATLEFFAPPEFANRHGGVQGGILGAMLDSATAAAVFASLPAELTAVTMTLDTRFLKPAPLGRLTAVSRVVSRSDREAQVEGEILLPNGEVAARATARLRIRPRV